MVAKKGISVEATRYYWQITSREIQDSIPSWPGKGTKEMSSPGYARVNQA